MAEVGDFDFESEEVQRFECLGVGIQDSLPDQVLALCLLPVAYVLFNSPTLVILSHDMTIAGQTSEYGHLVDLKLLEAHEKVVNVTILALHDNLCEHSR